MDAHLTQMTANDLKAVGKCQQQCHQIFPVPLHGLALHAAFGGQGGDGELSGRSELRKKSGILPRTGQHTMPAAIAIRFTSEDLF